MVTSARIHLQTVLFVGTLALPEPSLASLFEASYEKTEQEDEHIFLIKDHLRKRVSILSLVNVHVQKILKR